MKDHLKEFAKQLQRFDRHGKNRVFSDFLTLVLVKDVGSMYDTPLHSVILTNFHGHWKTA